METPFELSHTEPARATYPCNEVRAVLVREASIPTLDSLLNRAELVAEAFRHVTTGAAWYDPDKEVVLVFGLNRRNRVIGFNLVSLGSATASLAHNREIFRPLIAMAATGFVLCHSHPSGDPSPSQADMKLTSSVREAAKIMELSFLDHVVVGAAKYDPSSKGYYSFREAGLV